MAGIIHNTLLELEQRLQKTITQRFRDLTFVNGVDIPTTFDLEPGATSVSVDVLQGYGTAALLGREGQDIPLVKVQMTKDYAPVVMAVAGYSVSFQTQRSYDFSGKSDLITNNSVLMVRRAIDERLNWFAAYGETALGARGLYNPIGVTPVVNAFNPNTADYSAWITFVMDLVLSIGFATNSLQVPNTIVMSQRMMARAAQVTDPQNASISVIQAIRARLDALGGDYAGIQLVARPESNSAVLEARGVMAGGTNRDRVLVYRKDPMSMSRQMEASIAQMLPEDYVQKEGMNLIYPMFACSTATQLHETNAIQLIDVTRAT